MKDRMFTFNRRLPHDEMHARTARSIHRELGENLLFYKIISVALLSFLLTNEMKTKANVAEGKREVNHH